MIHERVLWMHLAIKIPCKIWPVSPWRECVDAQTFLIYDSSYFVLWHRSSSTVFMSLDYGFICKLLKDFFKSEAKIRKRSSVISLRYFHYISPPDFLLMQIPPLTDQARYMNEYQPWIWIFLAIPSRYSGLHMIACFDVIGWSDIFAAQCFNHRILW